MNIRELIQSLEEIYADTGDLPVTLCIDLVASHRGQYEFPLEEVVVSTRYANGTPKGTPTKIILLFEERAQS